MNYITTNIRLPKEDYMRLKQEAASRRKSLSAVIREKLGAKEIKRSKVEIEAFLEQAKKEAAIFGKKMKGFNSVEFIRQDRDSDHGHNY